MSQTTKKPTHRLIRYYGSGKHAKRAELGAIWTNEDGSLSISLNTPTEQIWFSGFEIKDEKGEPAQ